MVKFAFAAVFTLSFTQLTLAQVTFSDNFNNGIHGSWTIQDTVKQFTGLSHANVSPEGGAIRINVPTPADRELGSAGGGLSRTDFIFDDFEMSVDVLENNSSEQGFVGLSARAPDFALGYFVGVNGDPTDSGMASINISRGDTGSADGPPVDYVGLTFETFEVPDDSGLRILFRGDGPSLAAQVFSLSDASMASPLATISVDDSTYVQGYGEIFASASFTQQFESFANVLVDNYAITATPVPEPGAAYLILAGCGILLQFRRRAPRDQAATTLP